MSTAVLERTRPCGPLTSADRALLAASARLERLALARIARRRTRTAVLSAAEPAVERRRDAVAAAHTGLLPR